MDNDDFTDVNKNDTTNRNENNSDRNINLYAIILYLTMLASGILYISIFKFSVNTLVSLGFVLPGEYIFYSCISKITLNKKIRGNIILKAGSGTIAFLYFCAANILSIFFKDSMDLFKFIFLQVFVIGISVNLILALIIFSKKINWK